MAEDARLNRKVNFDKVKEIEKKYKVANKDKIAAKYKEYSKVNRGKLRAKEAKRLAAKKQRTPKWLTKDQIADMAIIYAFCPKGHHVNLVTGIALAQDADHRKMKMSFVSCRVLVWPCLHT